MIKWIQSIITKARIAKLKAAIDLIDDKSHEYKYLIDAVKAAIPGTTDDKVIDEAQKALDIVRNMVDKL